MIDLNKLLWNLNKFIDKISYDFFQCIKSTHDYPRLWRAFRIKPKVMEEKCKWNCPEREKKKKQFLNLSLQANLRFFKQFSYFNVTFLLGRRLKLNLEPFRHVLNRKFILFRRFRKTKSYCAALQLACLFTHDFENLTRCLNWINWNASNRRFQVGKIALFTTLTAIAVFSLCAIYEMTNKIGKCELRKHNSSDGIRDHRAS